MITHLLLKDRGYTTTSGKGPIACANLKNGYWRSGHIDNENPTCKRCIAILAKCAGLNSCAPIEVIKDRLEELGLQGENDAH